MQLQARRRCGARQGQPDEFVRRGVAHHLAIDILALVRFPGCMSQVVVPEDPPVLPGDFEVVVKVRSEHTNGVMAVIEETIQPGRLVSPHTHENDVWVYVLAGEIGVLVGDTIATAGQGSWALKPRNMVHAMWNAAPMPARVIEILTPGGSELWFEELAMLAPGDAAGFEAACQRHGIRFLRDSPWAAELRARFGLK
jgi:quercetin dioxygenase-like cupin family protein